MSQNDDQLRALLKNWRGLAPRASFEADVRRRIRQAAAEQSAPLEWLAWWQGPMWKPALGLALVLLVSVIGGSSAGILSVFRKPSTRRGELQFMSGGTLSGGYVKLATEHRP